jgi:hypothetical protein
MMLLSTLRFVGSGLLFLYNCFVAYHFDCVVLGVEGEEILADKRGSLIEAFSFKDEALLS